jgi:hypothetical protein
VELIEIAPPLKLADDEHSEIITLFREIPCDDVVDVEFKTQG